MNIKFNLKKYLLFLRKICAIFLIASIVFILLFFTHKIFTIKTIQIIGSNYINGSDQFVNSNLLYLDTKNICRIIKKENTNINQCVASKILPDILQLTVTEFEEVAALKISNGYFILNKNAVLLEKNKKSVNLPIINFYQKYNQKEYNKGDQILSLDIQKTLYAISELNNYDSSIIRVDIKSQNMIVLHTKNLEILLSTKKDLNEQINKLKKIIIGFKIKNIVIKKIDLRFNKPVVIK